MSRGTMPGPARIRVSGAITTRWDSSSRPILSGWNKADWVIGNSWQCWLRKGGEGRGTSSLSFGSLRKGAGRGRSEGAGPWLTCLSAQIDHPTPYRSEEHTSELQSLMSISYAV